MNMLNSASKNKIKQSVEYRVLESQLGNYQSGYDRLVALDRVTKANKEYAALISETASKLTALLNQKTASSVAAIAMNIALAILLELSVLACHISMKTLSENNALASARTKLAKGMSADNQNAVAIAKEKEKSADKLSAKALASLLASNADESLSYRKIAVKYGVKNNETIKAAKQILDDLAAKSDSKDSNIILLPTFS